MVNTHRDQYNTITLVCIKSISFFKPDVHWTLKKKILDGELLAEIILLMLSNW